MDCPFPKLDKYLTKLCDKVVVSKSTVSRYYYVKDHVLRVSDHISYNLLGTDYSIVIDPSHNDNYIIFNPATLMCTSMNYDELKQFVKSWCTLKRISVLNDGFFSRFTPAQMNTINSFIKQNQKNIK